MLVEAAERALAHTCKSELLLGGGVACNSRLKEMCKIMCEERQAVCFVPENSLLVDNGAFIAFTGEILFNNKEYVNVKDIDKLDIKPRQRTDVVEIRYR
jgi:N6-L-threonylcarbamoyladenine synthase